MKRLYLTLSNELSAAIDEAAKKAGIVPNVLAVSILEQVLFTNSKTFDYAKALEALEKEAVQMPAGEFVLSQLPSYSKLTVAEAEACTIKPSVVRARLGKAFNRRVEEGFVPGVTRATKPNGDLKFRFKAAVYLVK